MRYMGIWQNGSQSIRLYLDEYFFCVACSLSSMHARMHLNCDWEEKQRAFTISRYLFDRLCVATASTRCSKNTFAVLPFAFSMLQRLIQYLLFINVYLLSIIWGFQIFFILKVISRLSFYVFTSLYFLWLESGFITLAVATENGNLFSEEKNPLVCTNITNWYYIYTLFSSWAEKCLFSLPVTLFSCI